MSGSRTTGHQRALALLTYHVALLSSFGLHYAKLKVPIGIGSVYTTEVVIVMVLLIGHRRIWPFRWDKFDKLVLAFLLLGIAWLIVGGLGDSGAGTKAFSFFVYTSLFFAVRGLARSQQEQWRIFNALLVGSVVAACLGVAQMISGYSIIGIDHTSTGSTRWLTGEYGLYAVMSIYIVMLRYLKERSFTRGSVVALVAASVELVVAQHRSSYVAMAVAGLAAAWIVGAKRIVQVAARFGIAIVIGIVVVVYFFGGSYLEATLERIQSTGDTGDGTIAWRLLSWFEVGQGVVDRPFGHGFATWEFFFNWDDPLRGSHNSLLDLAYRVGVCGPLLLLGTWFVLSRQARATLRQVQGSGALEACIACVCVFALFAYAFLNMVLEAPFMSVFVWLLFGLAAASLDRHASEASPRS